MSVETAERARRAAKIQSCVMGGAGASAFAAVGWFLVGNDLRGFLADDFDGSQGRLPMFVMSVVFAAMIAYAIALPFGLWVSLGLQQWVDGTRRDENEQYRADVARAISEMRPKNHASSLPAKPGREASAEAGVDDAESIALGVGQHDEVRNGRVVPGHASGAKPDQPVHLGRLLGRAVDHEIEVDPRPLLDGSDRPMHSDACSDTIGRNQDRETVTGARKPDDVVAQHVGPEGGSTIHVVSTQDDRPEA
jgi:hypothetical protein